MKRKNLTETFMMIADKNKIGLLDYPKQFQGFFKSNHMSKMFVVVGCSNNQISHVFLNKNSYRDLKLC